MNLLSFMRLMAVALLAWLAGCQRTSRPTL